MAHREGEMCHDSARSETLRMCSHTSYRNREILRLAQREGIAWVRIGNPEGTRR
jgi:hypothetical protein